MADGKTKSLYGYIFIETAPGKAEWETCNKVLSMRLSKACFSDVLVFLWGGRWY